MIRIIYRDKPRDRAQPTEDKGLSVVLVNKPKACYTDTKTKLRILSGLI